MEGSKFFPAPNQQTSKIQNKQAFKGPYNPPKIKPPTNFCLIQNNCWVAYFVCFLFLEMMETM